MPILSIILTKHRYHALHHYSSCTTGTYHPYAVDVPYKKQGIRSEYAAIVYRSGDIGHGVRVFHHSKIRLRICTIWDSGKPSCFQRAYFPLYHHLFDWRKMEWQTKIPDCSPHPGRNPSCHCTFCQNLWPFLGRHGYQIVSILFLILQLLLGNMPCCMYLSFGKTS